jgi:hypothetical protein
VAGISCRRNINPCFRNTPLSNAQRILADKVLPSISRTHSLSSVTVQIIKQRRKWIINKSEQE